MRSPHTRPRKDELKHNAWLPRYGDRAWVLDGGLLSPVPRRVTDRTHINHLDGNPALLFMIGNLIAVHVWRTDLRAVHYAAHIKQLTKNVREHVALMVGDTDWTGKEYRQRIIMEVAAHSYRLKRGGAAKGWVQQTDSIINAVCPVCSGRLVSKNANGSGQTC